MELFSTAGKAAGRFLAKTWLKKAYSWARRWYYHNIRGEKTPEEKLKQHAKRIENLEEREDRKERRIEAKEEKIEKQEKEIAQVSRDLSVKERLMESLEIKGISRQELFRKNLDNPTPFLIFRTGGQRSTNEEETDEKWLRAKLESNYGADTVGSSYVIPPDHFPEKLLSGETTLPDWIEEELDEPNTEANLVYVAWVDLMRGNVYWRQDYESTSPMQILGERFDISNYVEGDFYDFDDVKDALELVKKGDIAFFAAKFLTEDEIKQVHEKQAEIEKQLDNPSLKELHADTKLAKIESVLQRYVADPQNVAEGIKQEAEIWYNEIYSSE